MATTHGFFRDMGQMAVEYDAWQDVVAEFRRLNIDVNDPKYNRLAKAICVWGERLHELRRDQDKTVATKASLNYRAQYLRAKNDNP